MQSKKRHSPWIAVVVLLTGLWPLSCFSQEFSRMLRASDGLSFVGPSPVPGEVFVADGNTLLRMDRSGRISWSMKLETPYPVRECLLADSIGDKIFLQQNSHGYYHVPTAKDIAFRVYSLQKKEKTADLISEMAFWPEAVRGRVLVTAYQSRFTPDGERYLIYQSGLVRMPDKTSRMVYGSTVASLAVSQTGDTLAAGLRDGRIILYRGGGMDSMAVISTGKEPVVHMALAQDYLIWSAGDTLINLYSLQTGSRTTLRCERSEFHVPFLLSADRSRLCYIGDFGSIMWQSLKDPESRDTVRVHLPVFTRYWATGGDDNRQWFLLTEQFGKKYIRHIHLDSLRKVIIKSQIEGQQELVRRKAFGALVNLSMLNRTDLTANEIMVNQLPDRFYAEYFKSVKCSRDRHYSLFVKDKTALVFHMPSGRIFKQFNFPEPVAGYTMSADGNMLAFSFEPGSDSYLSGAAGAQIVVYDLFGKTGESIVLNEIFTGSTPRSPDTLQFTVDGKYLYTGRIDRYGDRDQNALRLSDYSYVRLEQPPLQPVVVYPADSFRNTAAAAILTAGTELEWRNFSVTGDRISLNFGNHKDLHLNLANLRTEAYWDPAFCGEQIYNFSLSNPLWKQLGIVPAPYDFYYKIYNPQILNDSLIVFTEMDNKDITRQHVHIADIRHNRIIQTLKQENSYALAEPQPGGNPASVYLHSGLTEGEREDLAIWDPAKGAFTTVSLNRVIRRFKKNYMMDIRYSRKFSNFFRKKILKKNPWEITRKEYLENKVDFDTRVSYLCRAGEHVMVLRIYDRVFVYDYLTDKVIGRPLYFADYVKSAAAGPDGFVYAGTARGIIYRWKPGSDSLQRYAETSPGIEKLQITDSRIFVLCANNRMHVFGRDSGREQVRILAYLDDSRQPVISMHTPDLYYHAEKQGVNALHISSRGMQMYNAGQFDLLYNRPDEVLRSLSADPSTVELYRLAREKRLRKQKVPPAQELTALPVPELKVPLPEGWKDSTQLRDFTLHLIYNDSLYPPASLQVLHNNVPLLGRDGFDVQPGEREWKIPVSLVPGANELVCTATNTAGMSSWGSSLKTVYKPVVRLPRALYLINIGVSKYEDSAWNLRYAAKDAHDLNALLLKTTRNLYDTLHHVVLTDTAATVQNLRRVRTMLMKSRPQDAVLLSFAGHGILDTALNYYLGFPGTRFDQPAVGGLPYEEMEGLLDSIPALHKAMLIDACHSGEVDREEYHGWKEAGVSGRRVGRGASLTVVVKEEKVSVGQLTADLFADLRRGTGATVLSASGGLEMAMEGGDIENGLFTWCVREGLENGKADDNRDGEIWLSELQAYVTGEVDKRSGGLQRPTARIFNGSADIRLK